ncbi:MULTISPECIES: TetR/AcrR family transcriptional regulator [Nocardia]|uniref:TetR/AcrR family transcriptional regulator n=1 Tax=Nocardia TaxID=1817 RepID=UPI0018953144|nr:MULTISPECIES: TetR/AcrR family transcriptional regulator [Nocardia]MBF6352526.1 TetR/AcrR family transcriptional regulator [Nocardia flavorosea]
MPGTAETSAAKPLPGRKAQAARNDRLILDAARAVFLADANAPISAVAERAGVGISALYRRYPSKDVLLRTLCHDGLRRYNAEADAALEEPDGWQALVSFLERVVHADVHSLAVHLAGTFTPDESLVPDVRHSEKVNNELIRRAHESGQLRRDVTPQDLGLILEACAAVSTPDAERTGQLRRRILALMLAGLRDGEELPGPPPRAGEFAWRWKRDPGPGAAKPAAGD